MQFVNEFFKFPKMNKAQEFVIYPCLASDPEVKLQSDNRVVKVLLATGAAILCKDRKDLMPFKLTLEQLELVRNMHQRMTQNTRPDRTFLLPIGGL